MAFLYKRNAVSLTAKQCFAKSVMQMSNHSKSTIFEFFSSKAWKFKIIFLSLPCQQLWAMISVEVDGAAEQDTTWWKSVTRCFVDWSSEITTKDWVPKTMRSLMSRVCWKRIPSCAWGLTMPSTHTYGFISNTFVGITLFVSTQGCGRPQMTDGQKVDTHVFCYVDIS